MFLNNEAKKNAMRNIPIRIIAVVVVAVLCATSVFGATVNSYTVTIRDEDKVLTLKTSAENPNDILAQAGVSIGENDFLDLSAFSVGRDGSITVKRAFPVKVIDAAGQEQTVMTVQSTVAQLLSEINLSVSPTDVLNYDMDEPLRPGMCVQIKSTVPVTVVVDGKATRIAAVPGSIMTTLNDAGMPLGSHDEVSPAKFELVKQGMVINVNRAKAVYRTETEEIPYSVIRVNSKTLAEGKTQKIQSGRVGQKSVVYKDIMLGDKVFTTVVVSEAVSCEPVDEKILVGTKKPADIIISKPSDPGSSNAGKPSDPSDTSKPSDPADNNSKPDTPAPPSNVSNAAKGAISTLTPPSWLMIENGVPNKYRYILRGESTAYYEPKGSLTSTGKKVRLGYIAVDPREIPYGTEMYIVSADGKYVYGYCIAADTGGFIHNSDTLCDLYMSSVSACRKFGRRDVIIYVL